MPQLSGQLVEAMKISPEDVKRRLESGEQATVIDVRGQAPWESSNEKIRGAIRVNPFDFRIDARWPKDRFTVLY